MLKHVGCPSSSLALRCGERDNLWVLIEECSTCQPQCEGEAQQPKYPCQLPSRGVFGSGNIPSFLACWLCPVNLVSLHVLCSFDLLCTLEAFSLTISVLPD